MDDQISEVLKRLEQIEQELSELRGKVDAITDNAIPTKEKKPEGKLFLYIGIPILLLCLLTGGFFAFRANQKPSNVEPEIGDVITFGQYEQNNSKADGLEPIEWIVLDKQDEKILLLSKYNLFTEQYSQNHVSWSDSTIRKNLNGDFISSAFSSQEQNQICSVDYVDTQGLFHEKVFLLNEEEVKNYFSTAENRMALPTETCINKSGKTASVYRWWTRTVITHNDPYVYYGYVFVNEYGGIDEIRGTSMSFGVRPALWLDISK